MSGSLSKSSVRHITLEYLQKLLDAKGAAWVKFDSQGPELTKILCSIPRTMSPAEIFSMLPKEAWESSRRTRLVASVESHERGLLLPCNQFENGAVFLWGVRTKLDEQKLFFATQILEHGELNLFNIDRFEAVRQQAFVDDLTGLYNSRYLKTSLTQVIRQSDHLKQPFSVLFIDVDHFKSVNDQYGHLVGSDFLVAIGNTVKGAVRDFDLVFRYGGDEFVVLLSNANVDQAKIVAERIRRSIEQRVYKVKDVSIQSSVSIGVATYPLHAAEQSILLKMADEAMYVAKKSSRNSVYLAVA